MKHRPIILTFAAIVAPVFYSLPAAAASASLNQKILPLNCVFETVNDGTGTVRYLTPAECGVLVSPSSTQAPAVSGNTNSGSQTQAAGKFDTNRTVFFVPSTTNIGTGNPKAQLPWQPLATAAQSSDSANKVVMPKPKLSAAAVAGAVVGVAVTIALVVFVI